MKQIVIIGLGAFGARVLEELKRFDTEIIIIDKDREMIEQYKDVVHEAYIVDVSDEKVINKLIPKTVDAVVLDLSSNLEVTILVTNYLKNMNVSNIIAKANSDKHGEILELVGATQIIFPDQEAARKVAPQLATDSLVSLMSISGGLSMAEIQVPEKFVGKTLIETNLRYKEGINVVAIKKGLDSEYSFFVPDYRLASEDILLAVGEEANINKFTQIKVSTTSTIQGVFQRLLKNNR